MVERRIYPGYVLVQMTLDGIVDVLATEGRLELRNFGVFEVRVKKARTTHNPKTGEPVPVPEGRRVYFKPGKKMEARVSNGTKTAQAETVQAKL